MGSFEIRHGLKLGVFGVMVLEKDKKKLLIFPF
jgi:hypothetical protein